MTATATARSASWQVWSGSSLRASSSTTRRPWSIADASTRRRTNPAAPSTVDGIGISRRTMVSVASRSISPTPIPSALRFPRTVTPVSVVVIVIGTTAPRERP